MDAELRVDLTRESAASGDSPMLPAAPTSTGAGGAKAYRRDIDGLRAVAVLPVLLFHAKIPGISGGYVGVDIFFVISGFLITGILHREIAQGNFSLVRFYDRRVRRILPALFAMMLVCVAAATVLMMPRDLMDFAKSLVATSASASNMLFWWQSGYFDGAAEAKPLLHTWSLAVEEQYYVLFPLALWALHRWARGRLGWWLGGIAIVSLAASVVCLKLSPISGFYLAPMRAWELMIGGLLAIGVIALPRRPAAREVIAWAGVAAIAFAILTFDAQTPFPGYMALLPSLGAAAIIYAGTGGENSVGRILSLRVPVAIGLISYSLYLWHWPALVFLEYYTIDRLNVAQALAALAAAFGLAWLSWRFVERPFRARDGVFTRKWLFAAAALGIAGFVAIAAVILARDGLPTRFPVAVRSALAAENSASGLMEPCSDKLDRQLAAQPPCRIGANGPREVFVWGDSHADALFGAFQQVADTRGIGLYYGIDASCPPLLGLGTSKACIAGGKRRFDFLAKHPEVHTVILASRWTVYLDGRAVDFGPAESNEQLPGLQDDQGRSYVKFSPEVHQAFAEALPRTVQALRRIGKRVILVYPIPETGYFIPSTIGRKLLHGERAESFTRPRAYFDRRQAFVTHLLDSIPSGPDLARVYPSQLLCDAQSCRVFADGTPLYYDDDHLSIEGARMLAPAFVRALDQLGATSAGTKPQGVAR